MWLGIANQQKNQSYLYFSHFLWMLTEQQLRRTIFPLGDLTKEQVRELARSHGYESLAKKRESQEICFIPDNDYRAFLRENVPDYIERIHEGEYIDADGKVLGTRTLAAVRSARSRSNSPTARGSNSARRISIPPASTCF